MTSFDFSAIRCELLHASSCVLPIRHGRLWMDRSSCRLESLVSDPHLALRGQDHKAPSWWTQIFGGLKREKSASSAALGSSKVQTDKAFQSLSKKQKRSGIAFSQKRQGTCWDLTTPAGQSCKSRHGAGKPLQATIYVPQCIENLFHELFHSCCVSAAVRCWRACCQFIHHYHKTAPCIIFDFATESWHSYFLDHQCYQIHYYVVGQVTSVSGCNLLAMPSPFHSLTCGILKFIDWYHAKLSYGNLRIV